MSHSCKDSLVNFFHAPILQKGKVKRFPLYCVLYSNIYFVRSSTFDITVVIHLILSFIPK
uniref:Uncharacterized protein n=1 Tax=Arundo donax TaxID=35708 RepID=A0A0A8YQF3_ARUDO